jgi:predicted unusual protein kinase regulating ubiquinone biosynthesis (AarF/ABC1/UbiB family)
MSKSLPTSRLSRLASLARVGVRSSAALLSGKDAVGGAEYAAEVLGNLRGLAAKIGQMGSYVDGLIPEGQAPAYEAALAKLRSSAKTSSFVDVTQVIESELHAPMDTLFASMDPEPVASASIGQVHRAVLPDGTVVAVKVQHTHIRKAIEADLSNAGILQTLAGLSLGSRYETDKVLELIRTRFREELDYALEAERQEAFFQLHAGDATVRIPKVYLNHSSASVLTTEFVTGLGFDEATQASEAQRRAWAETLWRFVFKGILLGKMFNADPHPGNYIFGPDGVVTFLDFGCVQTVSEQHQAHAIAAHRAASTGDDAGFRLAVAKLLGGKPGPLLDAAVGYTRHCFDPLFGSPYRLTRPWAANLVSKMKELAKVSKAAPAAEFFNPPNDMIFMNRLQFGFYSVLARLDVEVDYARVERDFLG